MAMHMIQGVNTLNTRKRKPKMTKGNLQRWAQEMQQYNKRARQRSDQQLTLDEYIDYVHGKGLPKKRKQEFQPYVPKANPLHLRGSTEHIPSADMSTASASMGTMKESPKYTGDLIVGIATMHKSNAVPVMRDTEQAKEISRMAK